jgi:transposase
MPKHRGARLPLDAAEEAQVRTLAHSAHAPADWILHAKMIVRSWEGLRTQQIASQLACHPETVRERLHAFNERGLDGLGMHPGSGRKPRLTQAERSTILALVKLPPAAKATYELTGELAAPDPQGEPEWTLDTLTAAARERGIQVARSQVRRIFGQERVRWRRTRLWATSNAPDFVPQGPGSSRSPPRRPRARRSSASTNSAPSPRAPSPQPRVVSGRAPHQGAAG